jgi:hypothetical protein
MSTKVFENNVAWEDDYRYWDNIPQTYLARLTDTTSNDQAAGAWEDKIYYNTTLQIDLGRHVDNSQDHGGRSAWEDSIMYGLDRKIFITERPDSKNVASSAWEDDIDVILDRQLHIASKPDNLSAASKAWEDDLYFVLDKLITPVRQPNRSTDDIADWNDNLTIKLDPLATWMSGTLDGDGKELITGYSFRSMLYHDRTDDHWSNPTNKMFGASADGLWKYAGVSPTVYEPICSLANGIHSDSWGFSGNEPLGVDPDKSASIEMTPVSDGVLRIRSLVPLTGQNAWVESCGRWNLTGDFDIEISWSNLVKSGGTNGGLVFQVARDYAHRVYIFRNHATSLVSNLQSEGSYSTESTFTTSATSGRFRLVRTGSNIQVYRDSGGGWATVGGLRAFGTWDCYVSIYLWSAGSLNYDIRIHDFKINSGSTNHTVGWRKEAESPGTHKGSRLSFPERSYLVAGEDSLNIIDADDNKLWMRFVSLLNYAYHRSPNVLGMSSINMSMHDGVLYSVNRAPVGSSGGHVLRVDFTLGDIRHISSSASYPFSPFNTNSGYSGLGLRSTVSHLFHRNVAKGFSSVTNNEWVLPGEARNTAVTHDDVSDEIVAFATTGGLGIKKFPRWKTYGAPSFHTPQTTSSVAVSTSYWCDLDHTTKEVFWMTGTHMYSASQATYEAAFGSTFSASQSKELPGNRSRFEQFSAIRFAGSIYVLSSEGIYKAHWPGGNWELAIGKPGSGAISEILSKTSDYPVSMVYTKDGMIDLLAICTENERLGLTQVTVVRLPHLTLYGKSELKAGRSGSPKSLMI